MSSFFKNYSSILLLLVGVVAGSILALFMPSVVPYLKPIGDVFLNLLFVAVIPLLFFAVSSSVANMGSAGRLGQTLAIMVAVFMATIIIASLLTILGLWLFPVTNVATVSEAGNMALEGDEVGWGERLVSFISVGEFSELLSRQSVLAFLIFSFLVGIAVRKSGAIAEPFLQILVAGNEVMKNLLLLIMKLGPVGLGAYFAYQVYELGPELVGLYAKPLAFYYAFGFVFFLVMYTVYAYIARGRFGVRQYWKYNITPSLTAISTCSSLATLPANLFAAKRMGIPERIANVVIPLGNTLHKNGSAISSIVKIYVAFAILGWNFFELETLVFAVGITILVSIVAGGIPNGGFIGEMLMISVYGIPNEAVPAVMILGALVDPLATILNATGDTVAGMLVTRFSREKFVEETV